MPKAWVPFPKPLKKNDGPTPRSGLSLKARAVGYLSRREHSRPELARKLARFAVETDNIEAVLDSLEKAGLLSSLRFTQSVVHRLAPKQGVARIVQELRQHGVEPSQLATVREDLQLTEATRARQVWQKRFGTLPADNAERARQIRFLMARGFSHATIRVVLNGVDIDEDWEEPSF